MHATVDSRPIHRVYVDGFWMDATEVTNAQFAAFVKATGYVTVAERTPRPEDFPAAPPDDLVAGSVVFANPGHPVPLNDYLQWWTYLKGANWRHPLGPDSSISMTQNGYRFVRAPAAPSWFAQMSLLPAIADIGGPITPDELPPGSHVRGVWLDRGWSYLERSADGPSAEQWRWMADAAEIGVTTDAPVRMRLGFVARAFGRPRRLQFSVGGLTLPIVTISDRRDQYLTAAFSIPAGTSLVRVESVDGSARTGTADERRLSVAMFRVAPVLAQ